MLVHPKPVALLGIRRRRNVPSSRHRLMIWTHAYNPNRRLAITIFSKVTSSIWSLLSSIWRMTLVVSPLSNETQNSAQNSKYSQVRVAQQVANPPSDKTISMIVAQIAD